MKKWFYRSIAVSFMAIPMGIIVAIWIPSLWRVPLTALVVFVCLFGIGIALEYQKRLTEQRKK